MDNFRIENKYKVELAKLNEVYKFLGDNSAEELYPKRFIKSIYFDNDIFSSYNHSIEGIVPRKKTRIRTYSRNDIFNKENLFSLENKINSVEGRYKTVKKNIEHLKLALGQDYKTSVTFYDASDPTKIEDMTLEVIAEADVHFVFFEWSGVGLNITSNSSDVIGAESKGINLSTDWTTTDNGSGNLRLELIHKPTNVAGTTRAAIGGETDIQVDWPIVVE